MALPPRRVPDPTRSIVDEILGGIRDEKIGLPLITAMGNVGRISGNIAPGMREEILALRAPSEELGMVFTATVGIERSFFPPNVNTKDVLDIGYVTGATRTPDGSYYAYIEWGSGGATFRALVDVWPEQIVQVSGTFIRIVGVNRCDAAPHPANDVRIKASVSLLPPASRLPSKFTHPIAPLAANAKSNIICIPPFARNMKIQRMPMNAELIVEFDDYDLNPLGQVAVPANVDCPDIPIPGNTQSFWVQSDANIPIAWWQIIYSLHL